MLEFDLSPETSAAVIVAPPQSVGPVPAAHRLIDELQASTLEAVSAPVLVHDGSRTLFANTAMQRLLGYSLAQLQDIPPYAWATSDCIAPLKAYGERCVQDTGQLPTLECEAMTASGTVRFLEVSARRIDGGSRPLALLTCQDLSDIRHVQTSLLDVGQVMHQILESNPAPTFVIDAQGRITHWNSACAKLTGKTVMEMRGCNDAWRAFHQQPHPLLADLLVRGLVDLDQPASGLGMLRRSALVPNAFELEQFFGDVGEQGCWLFCTAAPLLDSQGQMVGAIETLLDVTERHVAEEALLSHQHQLEAMVAERTTELRHSHQELDAFLENASVGIIHSKHQRVVRANRKFADIFHIARDQVVGLHGERFFKDHGAYEDLVRKAVPVLASGQSLSLELAMVTSQGHPIWVQLIAYASNPSDPDTGVWWLLQDRSDVMRAQHELERNYSEMKQTNQRLAEAQSQLLQSEKLASIGQLAAGVAHEINNPIGFVSSNLGSMRRYMESMLQLIGLYECLDVGQLPGDLRAQVALLREQSDFEFIHEDLPQLLAESEEGLTRVKKIVQDLKDFSRVDQSDWQEADINQGLESTLNVVMNEVKYRAEIIKDYAKLPTVRCRAAQLNQVFMNLIVNAAHAIPERGVITLSSRHEGGWVRVSVRDNGCGMTEAVRRRIFEPFYTTKPVGQGTGLGLSLSFSIVRKHGGRIEVESEPGQGSCFHVWIPVAGPTGAEDGGPLS